MRSNILGLSRRSVEDGDIPRQSSADRASFASHRGILSHEESGRKEEPQCPAIPATSVLCRVYDHIEMHLAGELTLAELGRIAQYSPFHLARLFRAATGQSLHQYIIARRLARARHLVESTDLPLKDIALEVGFSDQSHFSNHYRRAFGHTPCIERKARHHR